MLLPTDQYVSPVTYTQNVLFTTNAVLLLIKIFLRRQKQLLKDDILVDGAPENNGKKNNKGKASQYHFIIYSVRLEMIFLCP